MSESVQRRLMSGRLCRRLLPLSRRHRWWRSRVGPGPLQDYYRVPLIDAGLPSEEAEFLVLDIETSGLDPRRDDILGIGWSVIRAHCLCMADNRRTLVRPTGPVPAQSVVVHGLTDDLLANADDLAVVLPRVLEALAGRVLVAHHAGIESRFLDHACQRMYGAPCCVPVIDTLALEQRWLARRNTVAVGGGLRLAALRTHYGLPRYRAHDPLIDAIACGELLLAQIAHRRQAQAVVLRDLLEP